MGTLLQKGQKIDLFKTDGDIKTISVAIGWEQSQKNSGYNLDIDVSAFILNANGKIENDNDLVFYNNENWGEGAIVYCCDNKESKLKTDKEKIMLNLSKIPEWVSKIAFTATIYDHDKRGQSFWQVKNGYIRIIDENTNFEILRYELEAGFSTETAIVFGEIYRYKGNWKFNPIGSGYKGGLYALCNDFGVKVDEDTGQSVHKLKFSDEKLSDNMGKKAAVFNSDI